MESHMECTLKYIKENTKLSLKTMPNQKSSRFSMRISR